MRFPEITISGTPNELGFAHGMALSSEIESTIDFYATIFKKSSSEIIDRAKHFRKVILDYNPAFCDEIEGIAAGAKIKEPLWIYALNSRSEILALDATMDANECTALYFQPTALLGQNWDWGRPLEDLAVLMQMKISENHTIQMLTEPGIIGKIGLNSYGIGTCLNILRINQPLNGMPIHIVLRSILESQTLENAKLAIQKSGYGKASNVLCGDPYGNFCDIEFAGDETFMLPSKTPYMVHTNHFLGKPINPTDASFMNSHTRLQVANEKASKLKQFNIDEMKAILTDRSNSEYPIWRHYKSDNELREVGSVATIIMDLKSRKMHVRRGNITYPQKDSGDPTGHEIKDSATNNFVIPFQA
jgi:isopenicillin-N N-acyltransferase-like protein